MGNLLKLFFKLCVFRAKPQDLPASGFLLGLMLTTYALVSLAVASTEMPSSSAALYALADTVILALFSYIVLSLKRFPERLVQTLTALAGTGALFGLLAWPALSLPETQVTLLLAPLVIWAIAVTAFILREALTISLALSLATSLGYFSISLIALSALFPVAPQAL